MRVMIATWIVVLCAGVVPAVGAVPSGKLETPGPTRDQQVAELVKQLGDNSFRVRQAASKRLESMGPAILGALLRYRNDPDPEVAARVGELLKKYAWTTRGALVVKVDADSKAESLGLRPGDVVLKIDDLDVTDQRSIGSDPRNPNRTFHLWRDGGIVTLAVPMAGKLGFRVSDWDANKGGTRQALGVAALSKGRYEVAFRHLLAARKAGMTDVYSVERLIAAAEYGLDHQLAMEVFEEAIKGGRARMVTLSHSRLDEELDGLPFSSAETAALLRRMKGKGGGDLRTRCAALDYFSRAGRNYPLACSLTEQDWPAEAPDEFTVWRTYARNRVGFYQRRYDRVVDDFAHVSDPPGWLAWDPIMAAINAGRTVDAGKIAEVLLKAYEDGSTSSYVAAHALAAWMAAVAAGDEKTADAVIDRFRQLPPERAQYLLFTRVRYLLIHGAIGRRASDLAADLVESLPADSRGWMAYAYLDLLRYTPDLTLQKWQWAWRKYAAGKDLPVGNYSHYLDATCLLRLGQYDQAEKEAQQYTDYDPKALLRAVRFLRANRDKLDGPWERLRGVTEMYDGRAEGSHWATRWDGRAFRIDPDGRIREYPGLAPGELHRPGLGDAIVTAPNGVIYCRESQIYLLDEKAGRWVPTFASPHLAVSYESKLTGPTGPVVLRYVVKECPVNGPGRELMRRIPLFGGWLAYEFNGDRTVAIHPETLKLVDLSREIGRLSGKKDPAAIYWLQHKDHPGATMIPTDRGLWRMDAEGKLSRWPMPIKDPNVTVAILNWPKKEGKYYVGVAPQQGGQIYELDIPTGKMTLTTGFNGLGPNDSYHWFMDGRRNKRFVPCEYAVQRLYEQRLKASKGVGGREGG